VVAAGLASLVAALAALAAGLAGFLSLAGGAFTPQLRLDRPHLR
jgi:hypothetical protein